MQCPSGPITSESSTSEYMGLWWDICFLLKNIRVIFWTLERHNEESGFYAKGLGKWHNIFCIFQTFSHCRKGLRWRDWSGSCSSGPVRETACVGSSRAVEMVWDVVYMQMHILLGESVISLRVCPWGRDASSWVSGFLTLFALLNFI